MDDGNEELILVELFNHAGDLDSGFARRAGFKRAYIVCFDITTRSTWDCITESTLNLGFEFAGVRGSECEISMYYSLY
jgi:hypothetical protein